MRSRAIAVFTVAATLSVSVASGQEVKLPSKFVKTSEYFVGDWATAVEQEGKVYRGTWTVKWSPDKSCLITHWAADTPTGRASGTRIHGWDALAKKLLVADFGTNGSSSVERYTIVSDQIDEGEIASVDENGKSHKATARTDRKEPDAFTWIVTEDGKATVYKFRRVKK